MIEAMVTLVSLMLFSSAGIWLTQSQNIVNLPAEFSRLGSGDLISFYFGEKAEATIKRRDILSFVTYPMVLALTLALVAEILLRFTVFGRYIYAVGSNPKAAEISGVPARRVIILVFAFSGLCAAVASILYSGRLGGGRPTIGAGGALLDIIGATVIGGTSFSGGKGKISWTFIGVVFFVLLGNTLNYMSQGLAMFDAEGRLVVGNRRFFAMYRIPPQVVENGATEKELVEHGRSIGLYDTASALFYRERDTGDDAHHDVLELSDGRIFEISHQPMAGGGWVSTHEDVTERRQAEVQISHMSFPSPPFLPSVRRGPSPRCRSRRYQSPWLPSPGHPCGRVRPFSVFPRYEIGLACVGLRTRHGAWS